MGWRDFGVVIGWVCGEREGWLCDLWEVNAEKELLGD